MAVCSPIVRRWGRLEVSGLEHLPESGPVLLAANHDSYWDSITVGVATRGHRQVRALAKASVWKVKGLGFILDGMGQIPIRRGAGDVGALDRAISELRAGACIGVFPEGTRSHGRTLRARSGFGRLAVAVPRTEIVCAAIVGTTDIIRFPKRPRVRLHFFRPALGNLQNGEAAAELPARLLAEIRAAAPLAAAGRRP
jgi:1-acyl-sn-glycerol-3-phosphate acyltransferase